MCIRDSLGGEPSGGARKTRTGRLDIAKSTPRSVGKERPCAIRGPLAEGLRKGRLSASRGGGRTTLASFAKSISG
eukprot:3367377-Alexandrium_andersonii.AAC.1